MRKQKILFSIVTLILFSIIENSIFAQDWTQWRGANRDGKVIGFIEPKSWDVQLTQEWKINVGAGDSTPALVGSKIYVFTRQDDNEVVLCLDADDGKELWRNQYKAQMVTGAASRHPGPRSSLLVANGKVISLGVGGILSCLDASTGTVLWRKDPFPGIVPKFFTAMSPIVVDGMCIAHLGGAGNGAIIAYDLETGDEKWRWNEEGPEYASPVLFVINGLKQVVTLTEKSIVGIDVNDGKLLWNVSFMPSGRAYNASTPIVDGQTIIYSGATRGTKAIKIEKHDDEFIVKEIWNNEGVSVQFNTPILKDGVLFGITERDNLFCILAENGQTAWIDTTRRGSGGFGAILDVGSVIMALTNNSELIVIKPSKDEYVELAKFKVSDKATYAHPVISGNRIYIKDEDTLSLWTFK